MMPSDSLKGWTPQYAAPTRQHLIDSLKDDEIVRVMEIIPARPNSPWGTTTCHAFEFSAIKSPVRVTVREGTTQENVIAGLEAALALVRREYASRVRDTVRGFDAEAEDERLDLEDEKSGSPETPFSPTSGISREEKAFDRTAA